MAGKKGQKKRFWADEEKRSICEQALAPGVSVAQVARRYSMNANLIFKWLKDPRFSPAADKTLIDRTRTMAYRQLNWQNYQLSCGGTTVQRPGDVRNSNVRSNEMTCAKATPWSYG